MADLAEVDPVAAERSGNNLRRIVRALEIHHATGKPMSDVESREAPPWQFLHIGLRRDRDRLREALAGRVDRHIEEGLVAEVQGLLDSGLTGEEPAFSAIGYRQLLPYLRGESDLATAVAQIKVDTNRYVRHQSTWLRKRTDIIWFDTEEAGWVEQAVGVAGDFLALGGSS